MAKSRKSQMDQKIFAGHVSLAPEAIEASGQSKMQPKALLERSHTEKDDLSFLPCWLCLRKQVPQYLWRNVSEHRSNRKLTFCSTQRSNTSARTCVVDDDTLWLNGVNIRLKDFDTPESHRNICGSFVEIDLAHAATNRLQELLNGNAWTIEAFGIDGTGGRRLAKIKINGEDVGDILIREGLARRWPDGPEFWRE